MDDELGRVALLEDLLRLERALVGWKRRQRRLEVEGVLALAGGDRVEPEPCAVPRGWRDDLGSQSPLVARQGLKPVWTVRLRQHQVVSDVVRVRVLRPPLEQRDPLGGPWAADLQPGHVPEPLATEPNENVVAHLPDLLQLPQIEARLDERQHVLAIQQPEHGPDVELEDRRTLVLYHVVLLSRR